LVRSLEKEEKRKDAKFQKSKQQKPLSRLCSRRLYRPRDDKTLREEKERKKKGKREKERKIIMMQALMCYENVFRNRFCIREPKNEAEEGRKK
jgi:hypothetical protein